MTGFFYRREREHTAYLARDIGLRPPGISDVSRGAYVKEEKDRLFLFLAKGFYEGTVAFGRNVPVYGTDIVAILIRAYIVELQSGSLEDRTKIALHMAVDSLADLYFVLAKLSE